MTKKRIPSHLEAFETLAEFSELHSDPKALRAEALESARNSDYPSKSCLSQDTVDRWINGHDLDDEERKHASQCGPCAALLELLEAKPSDEQIEKVVDHARRAQESGAGNALALLQLVVDQLATNTP